MKSLFSRLRHNRDDAPPSSSREASQQAHHQNTALPPNQRSPAYSRLSTESHRVGTPIAAFHCQSSSSDSDSTRPHSLVDVDANNEPADIYVGDETTRGRTISGGEGAHVKKVTFRSPIPTPATSLVLDEIPTFAAIDYGSEQPISHESKILSSSPTKKSSGFFSRPPSASSRSNSRQSLPTLPRPGTARKSSSFAETPSASPIKSMMSPTPSEMSLGAMSQQSYLPPPNSWSEMAEDELIANLGPRERTRQEVLYEIVTSEERYVQELIKLNETFCRILLPPSAVSPSLNLFDPNNTLSRTLSPTLAIQSPGASGEPTDLLPIAAQFSTQTSPPTASVARMQAYDALTNGRPSETRMRRASHTNLISTGGTRSHHSLPPPKRDSGSNGSSLAARMSYHPGARQKGYNIRNPSESSTSSIRGGDAPLPEALGKVLTVLAGGILEGHIKLAAALRKRYDNQYPLVRSLADVFTSHSYILREYATYVNHLESALEQVEHALTTYTSQASKRASKRLDETDLGRLGKALLSLEELAAERGESGLQISLSKPFQRLLKYPLLFQNLLFNTDPSLKEYEATLAMVDDVEEIVRAIEDEKASMEEREKTRDVWARIEGLDKDKTLMAPKSDRLLVSEASIPVSEEDVKSLKEVASKQKKSFRRLSDILKGSADADLWVVQFTDVSLLCARTGMTHLPLSNTKAKRSESMTEMSGKFKSATSGRRGGSVKARNLYRFLKIHEWHLKPKTGSTEGLVLMDKILEACKPSVLELRQTEYVSRNDTTALSPTQADMPEQPSKVPLKGDGGRSSPIPSPRHLADVDTDTMVSDRLSVMSFAFKGTDQVKPVPRRVRPLAPPNGNRSAGPSLAKSDAAAVHPQRRTSAGHMVGEAANAKFAHRLRSHDTEQNSADPTLRPSSRTRQSLPPVMAYSNRTGRASPALGPTDRNSPRPAWNAPANTPKSKATSITPTMRESVRGVKGIDTSVTGQGKRIVPKAVANLKAAEGNERGIQGEGKAGSGLGGKGVKPSPSTDSGVAGMWTAYRDGGATGTPRKVPVGRQLGGRI